MNSLHGACTDNSLTVSFKGTSRHLKGGVQVGRRCVCVGGGEGHHHKSVSVMHITTSLFFINPSLYDSATLKTDFSSSPSNHIKVGACLLCQSQKQTFAQTSDSNTPLNANVQPKFFFSFLPSFLSEGRVLLVPCWFTGAGWALA